MNIKPYLSIVVTSRNDGGDDLIKRTQVFVDSLKEQTNEFRLQTELIFVEWNPPENSKELKSVIKWPSQKDFLQVKIIRVPPSVHGGFENSREIPLFQMIAKNVGVRRSSGHWVLCTNLDILFSNAIFRDLRKFDSRRMFRLDRQDVPAQVLKITGVEERLVFCRKNIIRILTRTKVIKSNYNIALKFELFWQRLFESKKRLHTHGCGDFTLMTKASWEKLKGYSENPIRAIKLDGLLCYAAHVSGVREKILRGPYAIYHIEHSERGDSFFGRADVPRVSSADYFKETELMLSGESSGVLNSNSWGMSDKEFENCEVNL